MVDSRLRVDPPSLFHCFVELLSPSAENALEIQRIVPKEFQDKEILLQQIQQFSYPCTIDQNGVQYSTFVLTDLESKFRFGFCRYPPHATRCLCIISYLPWFETFYDVLNKVVQLDAENAETAWKFLEALNKQEVPSPGSKLKIKMISKDNEQTYTFDIPDTTKLPTIPENRNLTEYFSKVSPENMVNLFISMLLERRIIVHSEKLSVLTAVIHGSVSLLYPMQWQHIYVPILPPHLIDYCCAPMPFLLGVHSSMMEKVNQMPMNEVVIFDADADVILVPEEDLDIFPPKLSAKLKKKLQRSEKAFADYVSSQFLNTLADLIGGYRDALKFTETDSVGKVVFDEDIFLNSRTGYTKDFLEQILALQSFQQFIAGRLDMLNDGVGFVDIFEQAVLKRNHDISNETKYTVWKDKMKKGGGALKKSVEGKYGHLKGIASEIEMKDLKRKIKDKYKGVKGAMKTKEPVSIEVVKDANVKRNNSMPIAQKYKVNMNKNMRHSMYSTLPRMDVPKPGKTPPPRPPRPPPPASQVARQTSQKETNSAELPRKEYLSSVKDTSYIKSHSEANIADLLNMGTTESLNSTTSTASTSSLSIKSKSLTLLESSSSETSLEHVKAYANPAFLDPIDNLQTMPPEQEDHELEHTPITASNVERNSETHMTSDNAISSEKLETTSELSKPHAGTSLKRSTHVAPRRPQRPPPISPDKKMPPPISPDKKLPPTRPPPPHTPERQQPLLVNPDANPFDDSFVVLHENDREKDHVVQASERSSVLIPNSPFYTPSADLLGLDQSLFHETMKSLSDDTRQLMTKTDSDLSHDASDGEEFFEIHNSAHSPSIEVNIAFGDSEESNRFTRSAVITNNPFVEPKLEPDNAAQTSADPFASIFEDVKRDMKMKR